MQLLKLQNLATIKLFNERTKLQKDTFYRLCGTVSALRWEGRGLKTKDSLCLTFTLRG